jgi:hypothetical protein
VPCRDSSLVAVEEELEAHDLVGAEEGDLGVLGQRPALSSLYDTKAGRY